MGFTIKCESDDREDSLLAFVRSLPPGTSVQITGTESVTGDHGTHLGDVAEVGYCADYGVDDSDTIIFRHEPDFLGEIHTDIEPPMFDVADVTELVVL